MPSFRAFAAFGAALTLALVWAAKAAAQPAGLPKRVAEREAEALAARANYTYKQEVVVEELDPKGRGHYKETREIIFSPTGERSEKFIGQPVSNLKRLRLTEEDFQDIRDIQPFLFTPEVLWLYQTKFRGEEIMDGTDCWVLEVKPRQVLESQRLFEGIFWIEKQTLAVIQSEGVAVPQILNRKKENLFPRFTTFRAKVDGKYWFPARTRADDILPFSTGPIRMRMDIRYSNYKRFGAESTIKFEEKQP